GLFHLQFGADVFRHVHLGHVHRHDLEGRLGVKSVDQDRLGNQVWVGQYIRMMFRTADGFHDAFADAGDDRLFGGPAHQPVELGTDRPGGAHLQLDAVAADAFQVCLSLRRIGAIDDARIDVNLNGFENVAASELDALCNMPWQIDAGFMGGDDGLRHSLKTDFFARGVREIERFHFLRVNFDPCLHQSNFPAY